MHSDLPARLQVQDAGDEHESPMQKRQLGFDHKKSSDELSLWTLVSFSDVEIFSDFHLLAFCSAKCLNGGKCVGPNKCQCSQTHRGPQCQHATDRCAANKIGFNGEISCKGTDTEMSCTLKCPAGVKPDSPIAAAYKCKFAEGKFLPAKIPKCIYRMWFDLTKVFDAKFRVSSSRSWSCSKNSKWSPEACCHHQEACSSNNKKACSSNDTKACPSYH